MQRIRNLGDIDSGLADLLLKDNRLAAVVAAAGPLPLRLSEPGFAGLAHIIVSQMVSKASAAAIWRRIEAACGVPVTVESYGALTPDVLATLGLSRAKEATLARVVQAITDGQLDLHGVSGWDVAQATAILTGIKGIGPWTAEVYLMFCGGHCDVFPSGDVALRIAAQHAFGLDLRPSVAELNHISSAWAPWRSVAARLFWAYYAANVRTDAVPFDEESRVSTSIENTCVLRASQSCNNAPNIPSADAESIRRVP